MKAVRSYAECSKRLRSNDSAAEFIQTQDGQQTRWVLCEDCLASALGADHMTPTAYLPVEVEA